MPSKWHPWLARKLTLLPLSTADCTQMVFPTATLQPLHQQQELAPKCTSIAKDMAMLVHQWLARKLTLLPLATAKVPNCNLATSSPATRTSTQVHQHCHFLGNAGAPMAGKKAGIVSTSYSRLHPNGVPNCTLATSSPATRTSTQVHQHCQGHGNAGAPMAGKKADILLPLATAVCTDC